MGLALLLQGCADMPGEPPKIERMTAAELEARLPQPIAALSPEQIVTLVREGITANEIIGRITESGSRYRLSASAFVDLARQGVPLEVLDYMVSAERTHTFDDMAAEVQRLEQACRESIAQEVSLCRLQTMQPMWPNWPHPFMNCYPSPPGSMFWHCL
jgi:hypothetical protein